MKQYNQDLVKELKEMEQADFLDIYPASVKAHNVILKQLTDTGENAFLNQSGND